MKTTKHISITLVVLCGIAIVLFVLPQLRKTDASESIAVADLGEWVKLISSNTCIL